MRTRLSTVHRESNQLFTVAMECWGGVACDGEFDAISGAAGSRAAACDPPGGLEATWSRDAAEISVALPADVRSEIGVPWASSGVNAVGGPSVEATAGRATENGITGGITNLSSTASQRTASQWTLGRQRAISTTIVAMSSAKIAFVIPISSSWEDIRPPSIAFLAMLVDQFTNFSQLVGRELGRLDEVDQQRTDRPSGQLRRALRQLGRGKSLAIDERRDRVGERGAIAFHQPLGLESGNQLLHRRQIGRGLLGIKLPRDLPRGQASPVPQHLQDAQFGVGNGGDFHQQCLKKDPSKTCCL